MLKPHRFTDEVDPGPVQIQARKVEFDVSGSPLHWIPGHPVASHMISLLNVVLPAAERWFVATYNEALPLVKDPRLAEDMRGFIGQEAVHAETHERMLREFMVARDADPEPILAQVEYIFGKVLAPSTSRNPRRRKWPTPRRKCRHPRRRLRRCCPPSHRRPPRSRPRARFRS